MPLPFFFYVKWLSLDVAYVCISEGIKFWFLNDGEALYYWAGKFQNFLKVRHFFLKI